jgi:hypothetical protein
MQTTQVSAHMEADHRRRRHWIQQERAEEVNAALIDFLKGNAASR